MQLHINGTARELSQLDTDATLAQALIALELKADRIAVEHNGVIVARAAWGNTALRDGDKLEIVQFVGGGCAPNPPQHRLQ